MSCGINCIKWILFIFNFVSGVLGIAILAYGIFINMSVEEPSGIQTSLPDPEIGITCIVLGAITCVIAFIGCCGAVRESHRMLVTYAVAMIAILIVQVAFGIWAFVIDTDPKNDASAPDLVDPKLQKNFDDYWVSKSAKAYIDDKQMRWLCCGVSGPSDYDRFENKTIPSTCCRGGSEALQKILPCTIDIAYENGCSKGESFGFNKVARVLGEVSFGPAAANLVGVVFALCLANSIKNDPRRGNSV